MQTRRGLVLVGTALGTFLASLDVTVVGTAMPSIVAKLGGLDVYPWVFSIYLLTSTTTMPLYGKAADLFGRKPVYLLCVTVFVAGSLLCATSSSMGELIAWRALQGLGAGGVIPLTLTIAGDLFPLAQRAKVQGLYGSVWAVSSVAGPALGAFIVARWHWEWIFLLNLPFGLLAAALVAAALHESVEPSPHRLDVLGALWLSSASAGLMFALLEGGRAGFARPEIAAALALAIVSLAAFVRQERRHPEPLVSPELLARPVVRVACTVGIFAGTMLWGITSYVPAFVQGVLLGDAGATGRAMLVIGLGWPIATTTSGRLIEVLGFRGSAVVGGVGLALAAVPLALAGPELPFAALVLGLFGFGLGMGYVTTTLLLATQDSVPWKQRGAATAIVGFSRTIGGAIGVAAMGAVLTASLQTELGGDPALMETASAVLEPTMRGALDATAVSTVHGALSVGLARVLHTIAAAGVLALVAVLAFPRHVPRADDAAAPTARATQASPLRPSS